MEKKEKKVIPMEDDYLHASSFQDFTGLIPAGPVDEDELDVYSEIFPVYPKIPRDTKE